MTTARYSTGEEPLVGDVVQVLHPHPGSHGAAGEFCDQSSNAAATLRGAVFVVTDLDFEGDPMFDGSGKYGHSAARFALIARAGDPVTYQPGDVVEALKDFTDRADRKRLTKGNRYIVSRRSKQLWIERCDAGYDCCWESGDDFRLVHRPVAVNTEHATDAAAQPDQPPVGVPLTTETARLLRAGDVLRATETTCNFCAGDLLTFEGPGPLGECMVKGMSWQAHRFAFIGRPDADGWISWAGGENPLPPGTMIEAKNCKGEFVHDGGRAACETIWGSENDHRNQNAEYRITAFRIMQPDTASASSAVAIDARARCAYEAAADDVRELVARLNDAVLEAQAVGVSCEFDTLERSGIGLARSTIITVTCRREV